MASKPERGRLSQRDERISFSNYWEWIALIRRGIFLVKDVKQNTCKFLIYRCLKLFRTVSGNWFEPLGRFIETLLYVNNYKLIDGIAWPTDIYKY